MNTYSKYCPNVFVAKCKEQHEKEEIIILTTKYGQEHECVVYNFLGKSKDGFFLYSITRADGFNAQERAKNKAERLQGYAANAEKRSSQYYEASNEGKDFLVLGEPIKIGHHSEKRHRALIERNWERMRKSVNESEKAEEYNRRAEFWEAKSSVINLSMPESLGYFEFKLEEAKKKHKLLKDNPELREHSYSLTYANKLVKELESNLSIAVKLWGTDEEIQQLNKEKQQEVQAKSSKNKKFSEFIKNIGGFFAFNTDQFKEGYNNILKSGIVEEGEKIAHVGQGLYIPSKNIEQYRQYK